jgi:GT2 family glycosyltransferase
VSASPLQTITQNIEAGRLHEALIRVCAMLRLMPVPRGEYFAVRAALLNRLGHHGAAAADRNKALADAGPLPVMADSFSPAPRYSRKVKLEWNATIIIPVHNGGECIRACVESVHRQLPSGSGIILIDDGSTDKATLRHLQVLKRYKGIVFRRHTKPRGYVAAINAGLSMAPDGPVILLNSDTYVPQGVIGRILKHLRSDQFVATVTPFSNNGGSFSLSAPRRSTPMPSAEEAETIAAVAAQVSPGEQCDVINANGFCMGISGACRRDLPLLSPAFRAGYYEEVDYSLLAKARGYRNVCAVDCFVAHIGSISFGLAKKRLVAQNLQLIDALYPSYREDFNRFSQLDPLKEYRRRVLDQLDGILKPPAPAAQPLTVLLPNKLDFGGRTGVPVPVYGPLSSASLQPLGTQVIWLDAGALSAHNLTLKCEHRLAARCEWIGERLVFAVLDGDKPVAAVELGRNFEGLDQASMNILEARVGHYLEAQSAA